MQIQDPNIQRLQAANELQASKAVDDKRHNELQLGFVETQQTILEAFKSFADYLENRVSKTQVVNQLKNIGTPDAMKVVEAVNALQPTIADNKPDYSEVVAALKGMSDQLSTLPREVPEFEQKDSVSVSNLSELEKGNKALLDAINALELTVKAPIVNVPKTQVKVDAPDLTPLKKSLDDVIKAVKAIKYPKIPETNLTKLEKESKTHSKLLKGILDKPVSSGGGGSGGRVSPYEDSAGIPQFVELNPDGSVPVSGPTLTPRFDTSVTGIVYLGKAVIGSSESAAVWQIKKVDYSSAANGSGKFANEGAFTAIWADHLTETYT
jgi:hypothetical protein